MKVVRFHDLDCWKASRELVVLVFTACRHGELTKDFETRSQLRRAATSAMNNIAEGFARFSTKDSIKFYDIAQSSAAEVESMTYILSDLQYLPHETIAMIASKALETKNRTLGLIRYLRRRDTGTRGDKSA